MEKIRANQQVLILLTFVRISMINLITNEQKDKQKSQKSASG